MKRWFLKTGRSMVSEESVNIAADFEVLTKRDIPGASLNGKKPNELNVVQLKRWLSCRGAPTGGKKPQLIERLAYLSTHYQYFVCAYLGWNFTFNMAGISIL